MDLGVIKQKIAEDKAKTIGAYKRYPVRFIFLELNNNTQNEILELVKENSGELLELSDYIMKKDDGWLTKSHFLQIVKNNVSQEKDTFVVGFSEMVRFYSRKEIETTILSLFDIENTNTMDPMRASRRIYFVCFSMMDNVCKVLQNNFPRRDLIDPFINSDYELSGGYRQICFVSDEYADNIKKNKIETSVEWIGLWRHAEIVDFSRPIWVCSASLFEWHRKASPDNAFQIDSVSTSKDYMEKVLGSKIQIPYIQGEEVYWKNMLDKLEAYGMSGTFTKIVSNVLGIDANQTSSLAGKWIMAEDNFDRWLIKNYTVSYLSDTYLTRVFTHAKQNNSKDFLITLWVQGYKISNQGLLRERLEIIKELNKYSSYFTPEDEINNEISVGIADVLNLSFDKQNGLNLVELSKECGQSYDDMKSRLISYYLKVFKPAYVGISNTEKEFLINLFANAVFDKEELRLMYPSLFAYLYGSGENLVHGKNEYKIYLQNYRQSKVNNADTSYISDYYSTGCASAGNLFSMYYDLEKQDVLAQSLSGDTDVYVVDGVGAEYIPLLVELIKQNGYEIELCDMAVAHLPSITEVNKAYLSSIGYKRWIVDFDRDIIHGEMYRSANNIRKSLDMLAKIIKDIISESYGNRVLITADHGATARAKWTETKKKYDFANSDHEGRCCKLVDNSECDESSDYIVYEDEINPGTKYVISLNENSLYNRPKYEDHGGATMEEVLVPVIVAVPAGKKQKVKYKVLGEKLDVSGLDKLVQFTIIPDTENAVVIDGDGVKKALKKVGGLYQAEISSGRAQDISVLIEDNEFSFKATNSAKKNMEGDDGFDD